MVFKNIQRIKVALPEVKHIVMFYNNGIIFQTTFEQNVNIPKLGENLAELVDHIQKVYLASNLEFRKYKKLIIETEGSSIVILKLGEESNIALFFEGERMNKIKLNSIRRYLKRIENLIDMDEREIVLQEILQKENELRNLKKQLTEIKEKIDDFSNKKEEEQGEIKRSNLSEEYDNLKTGIEQTEKELEELKARNLSID